MEKKYNKQREETEVIHKDLKFLDAIAPKDKEPEDENYKNHSDDE
jgi:hypothetical protein